MRLAAVILQGSSGATQEFIADHDGWDLVLDTIPAQYA